MRFMRGVGLPDQLKPTTRVNLYGSERTCDCVYIERRSVNQSTGMSIW
jgi:hypothetical protein